MKFNLRLRLRVSDSEGNFRQPPQNGVDNCAGEKHVLFIYLYITATYVCLNVTSPRSWYLKTARDVNFFIYRIDIWIRDMFWFGPWHQRGLGLLEQNTSQIQMLHHLKQTSEKGSDACYDSSDGATSGFEMLR